MDKLATTKLSERSLAYLDTAVQDWLKGAPAAYIACRDLGHLWPERLPKWQLEILTSGRVYTRKLQCGRCGMLRTDRRDYRTYERLSPTYEPPPSDNGRSDYYLPPGMGRLDPTDLVLFEIQSQTGGVREAPKRRKRK